MSELITKDQVIDWFRCYGHMDKPIPYDVLVTDIQAMDTVDAANLQQNDNCAAIEQHWIPVTERLPDNEVDVLILAERRYDENTAFHVISTAFHTDGKMNTEGSTYSWDSDLDMQYDEENDAYIVPEGWWEVVNYGEEFGSVYDLVTHWMPLPEPPKEVPENETL